MNQTKPPIYLGIYATSPTMKKWDRTLEETYYQHIREAVPQIAGLELPFFGDALHPHDEDFFLKNIDPNWNYVLTCITGNMGLLEQNKHFGLASDNVEGRQAAIDFHERARLACERLNTHCGRQAVQAVQFVASPTIPVDGVSASSASLAKAVKDLANRDWFGASLNLEHCDTQNASFPAAKGFMTLEAEIEAIKNVSSTADTSVGMMVNWGRSAIEHRSVDGPIKHIEALKSAGLLRAVIFSGATDKGGDYGEFKDTHMPFGQAEGIEYFESDSLLTEKQIERTLKIADYTKLDYIGAKVLAMPIQDASLERRVGLNRDAVRVLERITARI